MKERIPVNPEVLKWARETAGLDVEEVVRKIDRKRIDASTIMAWEDGKDSPSYPQLERMAYEIYKRPLALFFFPKPPQEQTPRQSFRTLPDETIEQLPQQMRFLIRKARVMQVNLAELYDNVNPASKQIIKDLSYDSGVSPTSMAASVRKYLGTDLSTQCSWKDNDEAFKAWRSILEEHGIFVFKEAFHSDLFSGFCLYDDKFPIIFVNNSKPKTRQIFTLFHELAHLLFHNGGIDMPLEEYFIYFEDESQRIEVLCNRFTGEFLVPGHDFNRRIAGIRINDASLQTLADTYHVSREVILRKLLDRNMVDQRFYAKKVAEWMQSERKKGEGRGNYYSNMGVYLSTRYMETAFSHFYQKRISVEQLADYLGVKVKNIPGMERIMFDRGALT